MTKQNNYFYNLYKAGNKLVNSENEADIRLGMIATAIDMYDNNIIKSKEFVIDLVKNFLFEGLEDLQDNTVEVDDKQYNLSEYSEKLLGDKPIC